MTSSEGLELKIFQFAESAGKAKWRPTDLSMLSSVLQFPENLVLVDALTDLHARAFMEFRHWENQRWVRYAGRNDDYFYRPFEMRVTFSGRKYFERLEIQPTESSRSTLPQRRPLEAAEGTATSFAQTDSSAQSIVTPGSGNPKVFVSHSTQDHSFVEKFATDLRTGGVDAWYSKWEIKPGDSIRAKIEEGLEGCEYFIIVLSKNSINRLWVKTELDAATVRKISGKVRKIIPVRIEDCGDLPPTLDSLCWEDFSNQPYESALQRVLDSIFDVDVKPPLLERPPTKRPNPLPPPASEPSETNTGTQFPIRLGVFMKQLQSEGFEARSDLFNGQEVLVVGPKGLDPKRMPPGTGAFFFPLWELNYEGNRPLVDARRFHEIFESRPQDWLFNRPYKERPQQMPPDSVAQPISTPDDSELRLAGPNDIDLVLEIYHPQEGKLGILVGLHNRGTRNLSSCTIVVRDARSFDANKGSFRESPGFNAVRVLKENCMAGFESHKPWLLRIETDRLEVGDTVEQGVMHWPTGDKNDTQKWRLFFSVTAEGLEEWRPEIDLEWVRRSNTIRLRSIQPQVR